MGCRITGRSIARGGPTEKKGFKYEKGRVVHDIAAFFIEFPQDFLSEPAYSTAWPSFSIKTSSAIQSTSSGRRLETKTVAWSSTPSVFRKRRSARRES